MLTSFRSVSREGKVSGGRVDTPFLSSTVVTTSSWQRRDLRHGTGLDGDFRSDGLLGCDIGGYLRHDDGSVSESSTNSRMGQ